MSHLLTFVANVTCIKITTNTPGSNRGELTYFNVKFAHVIFVTK